MRKPVVAVSFSGVLAATAATAHAHAGLDCAELASAVIPETTITLATVRPAGISPPAPKRCPLCADPEQARHDGTDDPEEAKSFAHVARRRPGHHQL